MSFLLLFLQAVVLPTTERIVYETNDKGKIGNMEINMEKTEVGYHTFYRWEDRMIEIIFDTIDMSTVYVKKMLGK